MPEIDKSPEQWKTNGDCRFCRRYKYCAKPCKVHNRVMMDGLKRIMIETENAKKSNDIVGDINKKPTKED